MSLMLILITRAASVLKQFSKARQQPSGVWIVNRSKHSSFRPEVIQEGVGFTAVIARRTGYSAQDWTYQRCATAGWFPSYRQAMRAGRLMAQQFADLRYRFD